MVVSGMNGKCNPHYLKYVNSGVKYIQILWCPLLLAHSHYLKRAEEIWIVSDICADKFFQSS